MTCLDIEIAIARYYGTRQNMVVPNVSWGLGLHECDLLIVSGSGYATEIEIKVSKSDLKKDAEKRHGHKSARIKNLFFAVPKNLEPFIEFIPEHAGIFICEEIRGNPEYKRGTIVVTMLRPCTSTPGAKPLTEKELRQLGRLASMRIWSLKDTLKQRICDNEDLREELKEIKTPIL